MGKDKQSKGRRTYPSARATRRNKNTEVEHVEIKEMEPVEIKETEHIEIKSESISSETESHAELHPEVDSPTELVVKDEVMTETEQEGVLSIPGCALALMEAVNHQVDGDGTLDCTVEMILGPDVLQSLLTGLAQNLIEPPIQILPHTENDDQIECKLEALWCDQCRQYCDSEADMEQHMRDHCVVGPHYLPRHDQTESVPPNTNSGELTEDQGQGTRNPMVSDDQKPTTDQLHQAATKDNVLGLDLNLIEARDENVGADYIKSELEELWCAPCRLYCASEIELARHKREHGVEEPNRLTQHSGQPKSDLIPTSGQGPINDPIANNVQKPATNQPEHQAESQDTVFGKPTSDIEKPAANVLKSNVVKVRKANTVNKVKARRENVGPNKVEKSAKQIQHVNSIKVNNPNEFKKTGPYQQELIACDICNKILTKKLMKYHKRLHAGLTPFTCEYCLKSFTCKYHLCEHMAAHSETNLYSCRVCGKLFKTRKKLLYHINYVHGQKPWSCEVCSKTFVWKHMLIEHQNVHHRPRASFFCDICKQRYISKRTLRQHKKIKHERLDGSKLFSCNVCKKSFRYRFTLKIHMLIHTGIKQFTCDYCGKQFYLKKNLIYHINYKFSDKPLKTYSCDICNAKFPYLSVLKFHRRVHGSIEPLSCKFCYKSFITSYELDTHSCQRPFSCSVCYKNFKRKKYLTTHKLYYCVARRGTQCHCFVCQKSFHCRGLLLAHRAIHLREKRYTCGFCGHVSPTKYLFNIHRLTHTHEKLFACMICDKQFASMSYCMYHERLHSGQKPYPCGICSASFVFPSMLDLHEKTRHTLYSCKLCHKQCIGKRHLNYHHKNVHLENKTFECDICYHSFSSPDELNLHFRHCQQKKQFYCDICRKRFSTRSNLADHKCISTGSATFSCESCKKRFKTVNDLILHACVGIKPKSILCHVCNKHFSKKSNLRSHIKREHDVEVFSCDKCNRLFSNDQKLTDHERSHKLSTRM